MAYGNPHRKKGRKVEDTPWSERPDFERGTNNMGAKASVLPGITKPGPVLSGPRVKRGRRISKRRKANDAAQALRKNMEKSLKEYER